VNGQPVALAGRVQVAGEALEAPFSGRRCACYSYVVNGQQRNYGNASGSYRQQLCLLGFGLAEAVLDCGSRRFPLGALPDVGADLRSVSSGGVWGERAMARIEHVQQGGEKTLELDARSAVENARLYAMPPMAVDLFVAPTRTGASAIEIVEDAVPVDVDVTVLGAYVTRTGGLDGQRRGGMKVFGGDFAESLTALDEDWRKGWLVGLPLLTAGLVLITLTWWWPIG
jgi:hypothetical protein